MKTYVALPTLPNFVTVMREGGHELAKISIGELSDDDVKELGQRMAAALLEHAKKKRAEPTPR